MSREIHCPACGLNIPLDEPEAPPIVGHVSPDARTVETVVPATACHDEPSAFADGSGVDVLASRPPAGRLPGQDPGHDGTDEAWPKPFPTRWPDDAPVVGDGAVLEGGAGVWPGSTVLTSSATPLRSGDAIGPAAGRDDDEPGMGQVGETGARRASIGSVLLGSYASAVTLALLWILSHGPVRVDSTAPTLPADSYADLDSSDASAFLARLATIPSDRVTTLGVPLRVGDLEVVPLEVRSGPVRLISIEGDRRKQDGHALHLRLRFRNLSDSTAFTPLDREFVRPPDRDVPPSLIVAGSRPILPFPLAVASEWEIAGQDFSPLEPGAERETVIVSESEADAKLAPAMMWRLRLRTSADRIELIGIRFEQREIRPR